MGSDDFPKLRFLAADLGIPKAKLDSVKRAAGIFEELEHLSLVTAQDVDLLQELMQRIQRHDLQKMIDAYCSKNYLQPENSSGPRISHYRQGVSSLWGIESGRTHWAFFETSFLF